MKELADWLAYQHEVLAGRIVAPATIRQACERSLADHARAAAGDGEWVFLPAKAEKVLKFMRLCPHIKGTWGARGLRFEPELWQRWIVWELHGWWARDDPEIRRFSEALIEIAKKNGKTFLAATLALFELRFGDAGAEVWSTAVDGDQAKIVWKAAAAMARRLPDYVRRGIREVNGQLTYDARASVFAPASRAKGKHDGLNPSLLIADEAAAIQNAENLHELSGAMDARKAPLLLAITTAQVSTQTWYYGRRQAALKMLEGAGGMDRVFAAIWASDRTDPDKDDYDVAAPECWIKSNPNLGVSVYQLQLAKQVDDMRTTPSLKTAILTKRFNIWRSAQNAWLEVATWRAAAQPSLHRLGECYLGFDLSQTRDLAAGCRLWRSGARRLEADFRCWLPEAALARVPEVWRELYERAIAAGVLVIAGVEVTDYDAILGWAEETYEEFDVHGIGVDPWNATHFTTAMSGRGWPVMLVRQTAAQLNGPTKLIETFVETHALAHEGEEFIAWQVENAELQHDASRKFIKVVKGTDPTRKIDAVSALLNATAAADIGLEPEEDAAVGFSFSPL